MPWPALASFDAAYAATPAPDVTTALRAESFADLLTPIPNAVALLQAADQAEAAKAAGADGGVQVAQYFRDHHHHHHNMYRRFRHHHHHNMYRRFFRHHHHHHHHNSYYRY